MIKIHNSESVVLGPMTGKNPFIDITIVIDTPGSAENMQAGYAILQCDILSAGKHFFIHKQIIM